MRLVHVMAAALAIAIGLSSPVAAQRAAVDLELAFVTDASGSIDEDETRLQRQGYVDALTSPQVQRAIRGGMIGAIAVAYIEFAAGGCTRLSVDWTRIGDVESARAFGERILAQPRMICPGGNAIGEAIAMATESIRGNGFEGARRVIDVSGDGPNTVGIEVEPMRDAAVKAGIVINALAIHRPSMPSLPEYYQRAVIGGPGSFVMKAESRATFAEAILRKMVREIASAAPSASAAARDHFRDIKASLVRGQWRRYHLFNRLAAKAPGSIYAAFQSPTRQEFDAFVALGATEAAKYGVTKPTWPDDTSVRSGEKGGGVSGNPLLMVAGDGRLLLLENGDIVRPPIGGHGNGNQGGIYYYTARTNSWALIHKASLLTPADQKPAGSTERARKPPPPTERWALGLNADGKPASRGLHTFNMSVVAGRWLYVGGGIAGGTGDLYPGGVLAFNLDTREARWVDGIDSGWWVRGTGGPALGVAYDERHDRLLTLAAGGQTFRMVRALSTGRPAVADLSIAPSSSAHSGFYSSNGFVAVPEPTDPDKTALIMIASKGVSGGVSYKVVHNIGPDGWAGSFRKNYTWDTSSGLDLATTLTLHHRNCAWSGARDRNGNWWIVVSQGDQHIYGAKVTPSWKLAFKRLTPDVPQRDDAPVLTRGSTFRVSDLIHRGRGIFLMVKPPAIVDTVVPPIVQDGGAWMIDLGEDWGA